MVEVGDLAPEFCLPADNEKEVCLKSCKGKWIVLYFYPKDNTAGCTREAMDFTLAKEALRALGAEVLGVSPDSPMSHRRFAEKHGLEIRLLSDSDHRIMEAYSVWSLKKAYGKERYGVVRSTFLVNPEGQIAQIWRSVKVKGHIDEVVKSLKNL